MSVHDDATQVMRSPGGGGAAVGRATLSIVLLVVGLVLLAVGSLCLYVKNNVLDADALTDNAIAALDHAEVRKFIAQETADQLIAQVPGLEPNRKTIEQASGEVVQTDAFNTVLGKGITVAETALLEKGADNTAMQLQNVSDLVRNRVADVSPDLAAQIPTGLDASLLSLGKSPALTNVLQAIDKLKTLGTILPPLAIALLIASVFAGGDRWAATLRLGVGLFIWGLTGYLFLLLARTLALDQVPKGIDHDAAGPVWDEVIGPYRTWLLIAGVIGLGLAAVAYWRGRATPTAAAA